VSSTVAALAQPAAVTSNTRLLVDATLIDGQSGKDVALFGLVHVQTTFWPSTSTLVVHANIQEDAFLAYEDQTLNDPLRALLDALSDQVRVLERRMAELANDLSGLQQELMEVLETDVFPLIIGHQIDEERAAELRAAIVAASAELQRLRQQLAKVREAILALIEQIEALGGQLFTLYVALGADAVAPSICSPSDFVCERVVTFDLVRPDGDSTPFQLLLDLRFSDSGRLLSGQAALGCETTMTCSVDTGVCSCP
jgi:hypothetical protein